MKTIEQYWKEMGILRSSSGLHYWDLETQMPSTGGEWRGEVLSYFAGKIHSILTDDNYYKLLQENQNCIHLKEALKDCTKARRVPQSFVEEMSIAQTQAQIAWERAKKTKDFNLFKDHLKKMIDMKKQYAHFIDPNADVYDLLLDEFSPGLKKIDIDKIFHPMKKELIGLVKSYRLRKVKIWTVPVDVQEKVCQKLMDWMGVSRDQYILLRSTHPFTLALHPTDVRLTTRYNPQEPLGSILATIHELGHALYEAQLPTALYGSPASEANGYDLHESQSRFWEVCLAHSKEFFEYLHKVFLEVDPKSVEGISPEDIYLMATEVAPSFIRVDADPVTYGLHIMIRYEMEKKIFAQSVDINELPKIWNELYKEYLGIDPKDDGEGILQDSHWSGGSFGYFPSYLLGSMMAAQLYSTVQKKFPTLSENILSGKMKDLNEWLKNEVHQHGRMKTSNQMMLDSTGEALDGKYWVDLLRNRFIHKKF